MDSEEAEEFIAKRSRLLFTGNRTLGMVEAKELADKEQEVLELLYYELKRLQEENNFLKDKIRKAHLP